MLGLAMILEAAIFLAAAFFRKKFLNLIMESIQEGASKYHEKATERIIQTNAAIARRLGLADMISDWWIARHNRANQAGQGKEEPPSPGGVWEQMPPPPPRPSNAKQLPPGGPPTIDIEPEPEVWEGRPPQGYPFKELGDGHEETGFILINKEKAHDTSLNTAGAIPKGIINSRQANSNTAIKKEAAATVDGAATPAGAGVTAAVNMALTAGKKVKEGVQGEVQAVAGAAASQPAGGVSLEGGREASNLPPAAGPKAIAQNQGQTWRPAKQEPEPVRLDYQPTVEPRRPEATVNGTANTTGTQAKPPITAQPGPPAGQAAPTPQAIHRPQKTYKASPSWPNSTVRHLEEGQPRLPRMPAPNEKQQER
ncbi:hypothetical protein MOOR_16620 [Moorella thermoacetica]|uniref:Uncharacterized protein n=1 Tax=Neomoorella thermoacetica TaxID=1525 RepID=A0A1J5JVY8_NEOTH|nr:hypothetical protein [Moorella thermoacetica]OIQ08743.1 hypothetical protein MOOR_16620 [Moorella thermoacetica]